MNLDYRLILKVGSISALGFGLIHYIKQLFRSIQDAAQIENRQVHNIWEVQHMLNSNHSSRLNLIKLKPYYFQSLNRSISIRSAQKMKFQPSDRDAVNFFIRMISRPKGLKYYKSYEPYEWFAIADNGQQAKYFKIYGFGQIQGDFFSLKKEFEPLKNLSYWTRFRNWISKHFLKILPKPKEVGTFKHTKPLFLGPVIGYLNYQFNLMKDLHIVAVCNFEKGKIIPTVTAASKSDIMNYLLKRIEGNYLKVAGFLVMSVVMLRWIWSDVRALINVLKLKRQKLNNSYFNPEVQDDKTCIICYTNCRNMIFFDCRHMIMCRQCSEHYESDVCPYCKLDIDQMKVVSAVK